MVGKLRLMVQFALETFFLVKFLVSKERKVFQRFFVKLSSQKLGKAFKNNSFETTTSYNAF